MDGWGSTAGSKKGNSAKELDIGEPKGATAEMDSKLHGSGVHHGGTCKTGEGSNGAGGGTARNPGAAVWRGCGDEAEAEWGSGAARWSVPGGGGEKAGNKGADIGGQQDSTARDFRAGLAGLAGEHTEEARE